MATTGGRLAPVLPIRVLSPGYSFDAIVVDANAPDTDLMFWPDLDTLHDMHQKILNNGFQRNVTTPGFWVVGSRLLTSPDLTGLVPPAEIRRAGLPVTILWPRDGGRLVGHQPAIRQMKSWMSAVAA